MKHIIATILLMVGGPVWAYEVPVFPYEPAAGYPESPAIAFNDPSIKGWAIDVASIQYGEEVAEEWRNPEAAFGPATGSQESVLVLGRGGEAVLVFESGIGNGPGYDFAVFENAISDTFLELAYVEVSTDGLHFVRFPNYSLTEAPVGGFGSISPTFIHGYAGKYRSGYGTPFDLEILEEAYLAAVAGEGGFSQEFRNKLISEFVHLDLDAIRYVKIIDIPGDGQASDAEGYAIYDPYPTVITAGFDLDAIAVLNWGRSSPVSFEEWSADFGLPAESSEDSDEDGWGQYMEYLFGSNPRDSESIPSVRQELVWRNEVLYLRTEYVRSGIADQPPVVLFSRNGGPWEEWGADPEVISESRGGQSVEITEAVEIPYSPVDGSLLVRFMATY